MNVRYFDNAATTRVKDEVLEEMLPYLKEKFGNPSSMYTIGREAKKAIENAIENPSTTRKALQNKIKILKYFSENNKEFDKISLYKGYRIHHYIRNLLGLKN